MILDPQQLGLSEEQIAATVTALRRAHGQSGNLVDSASQATGLDVTAVTAVLTAIGGEAALGAPPAKPEGENAPAQLGEGDLGLTRVR